MKNFVFALSVMMLSLSSCNDAAPATYYIPEGYEGVFAVVYSQDRGEKKVVKRNRRQFIIPDNGILLTQFGYSDGWRDDLFLIRTPYGHDTLKNYLPMSNETSTKFDIDFSEYTTDPNEIAVNFRQIVYSEYTDTHCGFRYELITIGRPAILSDSVGKAFVKRLESFLEGIDCVK